MTTFEIKQPEIKKPMEIEELSLKTILDEAWDYPKFAEFSPDQQKAVQRMIHSTTCFEEIINNIYFSPEATDKIKEFLSKGASIIVDTNMIKSGISKTYTEKYHNEVICHVSDPEVKEIAEQEGITRTTAAVRKALADNKDQEVIIACGNAPTMLYAAIEYIIKENLDPEKIIILAMPVGFINVIESKEYTKDYLDAYSADGVIMQGRYGGSPLIVSCIHALYKLI